MKGRLAHFLSGSQTARVRGFKTPMETIVQKRLFLALGLTMLASPAFAQDCPTTEGSALLADYPAVRAFYDAYSTANPALVDCALSPEWVTHPGDPSAPKGPDAMKPGVAGLATIFPSYVFKTEDVVAMGDKVAVRNTVTATQTGPFLGVAPAEGPISFQTIDIHKLGADGKIVESWHVEDWLSFLLQRGALPLK